MTWVVISACVMILVGMCVFRVHPCFGTKVCSFNNIYLTCRFFGDIATICVHYDEPIFLWWSILSVCKIVWPLFMTMWSVFLWSCHHFVLMWAMPVSCELWSYISMEFSSLFQHNKQEFMHITHIADLNTRWRWDTN